MAARHREYASLYRKVLSMKARIEKQKNPEQSSVGLVEADASDTPTQQAV